MAQHTPVSADPKDIERAQEMWHNVTQIAKWSVLGVAGLLIVMALIFIR